MLGRAEIFTDVKEITYENVIDVLTNALITHQENAIRCQYLLDYEAGEQPLQRTKTYRPTIDNKVIDNVAISASNHYSVHRVVAVVYSFSVKTCLYSRLDSPASSTM